MGRALVFWLLVIVGVVVMLLVAVRLIDAYQFWRGGLEVDPTDPKGLRLRKRKKR